MIKKQRRQKFKQKVTSKFQALMQHFLTEWWLIGTALENLMLDDHQTPVQLFFRVL